MGKYDHEYNCTSESMFLAICTVSIPGDMIWKLGRTLCVHFRVQRTERMRKIQAIQDISKMSIGPEGTSNRSRDTG